MGFACVYKLISNSLGLCCRRWRRDVSDSISTLPYIPLYMSYIVHQISVEQYCNDFTFSYSILRHYN